MENNDIKCPKCGSNQITANKKGFSGGKAVAGVVLTGGIGLLAGTIGSKNILITCLNCGNQFKPGEGKKEAFGTQPRLIWDENQKQHIVNSAYNGSVQTASLKLVIFFMVIIAVIIYFALK